MGDKAEAARSAIEHTLVAIPGIVRGCAYIAVAVVALGAAGAAYGILREQFPQWECIDIPTGMGPEGALRSAGKWKEENPFPVQVRVPWPNGDMKQHTAGNADEFYPPYELLDFDFSSVPDVTDTAIGPVESVVCYDRRNFPTPTPAPEFTVTP